MNEKAKIFHEFLKKENLSALFEEKSFDDAAETIFFQTNIDIHGQKLKVIIAFEQSAQILLRVFVVLNVVNDSNKKKIILKLNELNGQNKLFKLYIESSGGIILDSLNVSRVENFDPVLVQVTLNMVVQFLKDIYPEIMKSVWA